MYTTIVLQRLKKSFFDFAFANPFAYRYLLPAINQHVLLPRKTGDNQIRESALAHKWLDGLRGVEVGPSETNPFGLATHNIGRRDRIYEREQFERAGCFSHLHIQASADHIPLPDGSVDFVLSSHVIEHCPDIIRALLEWFRITRIDGIVFMIVPHRDAAPSDVGRPLTTWECIVELYRKRVTDEDLAEQGVPGHCHYHVFSPETVKSFVQKIFGASLVLVDEEERDDKVGNGFTLVYRKGAGTPLFR